MTAHPHRFGHLRPKDIAAHGVCGDHHCLHCLSVSEDGARELIEGKANARRQRKAQAQLQRRLLHGPAHTPEQVFAHRACGDHDCLLCKARGDERVMAQIEGWAKKRRWRQRQDAAGESGCGCSEEPTAASDCGCANQPAAASSCGCAGGEDKSAMEGADCGCQSKAYPALAGSTLRPDPVLSQQGRVHIPPGGEPRPDRKPFINTLMPDKVRDQLARSRHLLASEAYPAETSSILPHFTCNLCKHPATNPTDREALAHDRGRCPSCGSGAIGDLPVGSTWYVSASASASGSGSEAFDPMPLSKAREYLAAQVTYIGVTFLFDSADAFEVTADLDDSATGAIGGHPVDAMQDSDCWGDWSGSLTAPRAFLVVRCSGLSWAPVRLGSYDPPFAPTTPRRARIDGGRWCFNTAPDGVTLGAAFNDYPTHSVRLGLLFENTCNVEVSDLELTGFLQGIVIHGDCRGMKLSDLHIHNNVTHGIIARGCPELWTKTPGCTQQEPHPDDSTRGIYQVWDNEGDLSDKTAPAWLEEAQGYPAEIEITRCNFEDNGWGGEDSASTSLAVTQYCTNFHIHDNLFCMTGFGCAWDSFPPQPAVLLEDLPSAALSSLDPCVGDEPCPCGYDSTLVQAMQDACCATDPDLQSTCSSGASCECSGEDCLAAALQVKLGRGFLANPLADGECFRRGGDGITFVMSSSGHIVEDNTFIGLNKNCGAWSRPDAGCEDLSDGDGIDLKGVRVRTPDCDGELTVIRHNLFLFNEGAGIQMIQGTQGVEVYRNVFAGNGIGIRLASNNSLQTRFEWTCEDTDIDPQTGATETVDWYETGCVRIYRNLFYRQDRIDKDCAGRGAGEGAAIVVKGDTPLGVAKGDDDSFESGTIGPLRIRDVWIVNNTIDSNPGGGINITRAIDCVNDWQLMAYLPDSDHDDCSDSTNYLEARVRVTGIHVLNNLVTNNGNSLVDTDCEQAKMGSGKHINWVGQPGYPDTTTWVPSRDERRTFPEESQVDGNIWFRPDLDSKVIRYNYDQATWPDLVSPFGHETFWQALFSDPMDAPNLWSTWNTTGYTTFTVSPWAWMDGDEVGYDFELDWGVVELVWDTLDSQWNPRAFRPHPSSLASTGVVRSGILDHGAWSGRCDPPRGMFPTPSFASAAVGGPTVDVSESVDMLCSVFGSPYTGALRPRGGGIPTNEFEPPGTFAAAASPGDNQSFSFGAPIQ